MYATLPKQQVVTSREQIMQTLSQLSLTDPDTVRLPFEYYERMRKEEPVHFDERAGAWLVTRHDDIKQAARMTDVLSNGLGLDSAGRPPWQDEIDEMMRREGFGPHRAGDNFNVDPPLHARRRGLVNQAFGAHRVSAIEEDITVIVRDLMAAFIDRGKVDLVRAFSVPIAIYVISDLLGVPRTRRDDVERWSDASVAPIGRGISKQDAYRYARDMMEMHRFLHQQFEERRRNRKDDMLSDLVHAQIDDEENPSLSETELLSCGVALLAAGNETTRNGISWGSLILAQNPSLMDRLRTADDQDWALRRFVEETLRIQPPVPQLPRVAVADCEIGGTRIPRGSFIYLCWASANRDAATFENADEFDLERANVGQHLTFGSGVHRCLGAMLARMEMKCAFREIVNRMDDLRLTVPEEELDIWGTFVFRGPRSLPVTFVRRTT